MTAPLSAAPLLAAPLLAAALPINAVMSEFTTNFVNCARWISADLSIAVGVMIIDKENENIMLVCDSSTDVAQPPRYMLGDQDLGQFIASLPFDELEKQTGLKVERMLLPRLDHKFRDPKVWDPRELRIDWVALESDMTDAPFYVSLDKYALGTKIQDVEQILPRLTLWVAASCVTGSSDTAFAKWISVHSSLDGLNLDVPTQNAIRQFAALWRIITPAGNE